VKTNKNSKGKNSNAQAEHCINELYLLGYNLIHDQNTCPCCVLKLHPNVYWLWNSECTKQLGHFTCCSDLDLLNFFWHFLFLLVHEKKTFSYSCILFESSHFLTSGDYKYTSPPSLMFMHGIVKLTNCFWVATNVSKDINAQLRIKMTLWQNNWIQGNCFPQKEGQFNFTWSRERLHVFSLLFYIIWTF
jgi:hypothetical protein